MTEKQLTGIQQLLRAAEVTGTDCGGLSAEEIKYLWQVVDTELYAQRIKDFVQYLDKSLPRDEDGLDRFYNTDWVIAFGGKHVVVHNESQIYNVIHDLLSELVE